MRSDRESPTWRSALSLRRMLERRTRGGSRKCRVGGMAVALACTAIAAPAPGQDANYRVYRAPDTIHFERHCADAEAYQVQAYAELESEDGLARALVLAYARHDAVRRDDVFIGLRLVALRVRAGEAKAGAAWSMRMEARSATGLYVGAKHTHYHANPARGEGERRAFRADASGALDWLDYTEPDDEGDRGIYPHNWSPEMETTAAVLRLSDTHRHVALDLMLTATDTGQAVRLPGPMLWIPDRIWHERAPKPKTLGLLAALNPFEEGGIWQTLARGTKYRACIEERRAAKRRFAAP